MEFIYSWQQTMNNFFFNKDDNDNLWVEVIIVTFFNAVTTVVVLTANNNNVNRTFCVTIKSSFLFERINKVYRDFSHWQILSFVGPWNTTVQAAIEVRSIRNTACENNGVGENIQEHNLLSAKKCGKAPKSVWKSLIFNKYLIRACCLGTCQTAHIIVVLIIIMI